MPRASTGALPAAHLPQADGAHERAVRECLLERWGETEDIADAVRWLISPQASFITGQIININGGFRTNQK